MHFRRSLFGFLLLTLGTTKCFLYNTAATYALSSNPSRTEISIESLKTAEDDFAISQSTCLSLPVSQLATVLGGRGRAQSCWKLMRQGIDPSSSVHNHLIGSRIRDLLDDSAILKSIESVATVTFVTHCQDGTSKFLSALADGLAVETVIIPWLNHSTVCVSSQVGCRQACTFCLTGRMGLVRNLTTDEIVTQLFHAIRLSSQTIDNVVFMGQGEPADNAENVVKAVKCFTDPHRFALAPRKVTISTVAPNPSVWATLGQAPAVLAWSVHASRDEVRQQLVPTTRHSMTELRDPLIETLQSRSRRARSILLELALIDGINDTDEDAMHLVNFCRPFPGKVAVNLIPWNDIRVETGAAAHYRKSSRVLEFQQLVRAAGIACFVRTTRGDDELAACGQLSTKKIAG